MVCAAVVELVEDRLLLSADIFTVNATGSSTSGTGTSGTLPYVISLANADTNPDGSEIVFDPAVFSSSSPRTISLGATLTLSETSGPEVIDWPGTGVVSISGGGHALGVFDVKSGVTATISGLTITGGSATYRGGGVLNHGSLYLSVCTISGNTAPGAGGGLSNDKGTAKLTNCKLYYDDALNFGGAIFNDAGTAKLNRCTIIDNDAGGNGAGLSNAGTATLTDCTISGNTVGPLGRGWGAGELRLPQADRLHDQRHPPGTTTRHWVRRRRIATRARPNSTIAQSVPTPPCTEGGWRT